MSEKFPESLQSILSRLEERLASIETKLEEVKGESTLDDWIDEQTAKHITGLSKSTLYELRKSGKLTSSKLSKRRVFYRISDLSRLLDENEKL